MIINAINCAPESQLKIVNVGKGESGTVHLESKVSDLNWLTSLKVIFISEYLQKSTSTSFAPLSIALNEHGKFQTCRRILR